MGLLFGNKNKKNKVVLRGNTIMVRCPKCGQMARVTFLGQYDSYTCRNCGYKLAPSDKA